MKNYKKIFGVILASVMTCSMFTACGGGNETSNDWEIDKDKHWHVSESGEKTDVAEHSLEDDFCSVCGAEIVDFDGEVWVQKHNDRGDEILSIIYNADGNITEHRKTEYTYDEDGNWTFCKEYDNNKLFREVTYKTVSTEDESSTYPEKVTTYNEDGTKLFEEYDDNQDVIRETLYAADGTVEYDYTITTEYNEDSYISSLKKYADDKLILEIQYDYDADGIQTNERTYVEGKLAQEDFYTNLEGYVYLSKSVVYNEDGTQTVTEYDEFGDVIG